MMEDVLLFAHDNDDCNEGDNEDDITEHNNDDVDDHLDDLLKKSSMSGL